MSNRRKATPVELKFITAAREGERDLAVGTIAERPATLLLPD